MKKKDVVIRASAVEHHRRRREVLAFVKHVHERVRMIVGQEHRHENNGGGNPDRDAIRLAACQLDLPRAQRDRADRADHRQCDDDEVVEPLRILRNRDCADAARRNGEPFDAMRRDRENEQRTDCSAAKRSFHAEPRKRGENRLPLRVSATPRENVPFTKPPYSTSFSGSCCSGLKSCVAMPPATGGPPRRLRRPLW